MAVNTAFEELQNSLYSALQYRFWHISIICFEAFAIRMGSADRGHFLVIGAGFAGLATAIELRLNGFSVEVVEAVSWLTTQGW